MRVTDYFAELYVAGRFADAGWNIYFPHRDKGFDFVISKPDRNGVERLRPVQVKGKYPMAGRADRVAYGYVGKFTQTHKDMILAIPFFAAAASAMPTCTAYMPWSQIRRHSRGYRCQPAVFRGGSPAPRRDFAQFFDEAGLKLIDDSEAGA